MNDKTEFITEMLEFLNPSVLSYEEWLKVGFALKEEGFSVDVWDTWSRRDAGRYHSGECLSKWKTFSGNSNPVTGGTLYELASSYGYIPKSSDGFELEWDARIGAHKDDKTEGVIVNQNWIEGKEITEPDIWNPKDEIIRYLSIFDSTENVGYCTEVWEREGRYMPNKGCFDRTAGELIEALTKCKDICDVIGDYNKNAGAWIRFNPLDGKGVKNENVTDFRYALVESDSMEIEKQNAIIRELELPVAVLVYSGGKSLHAIVRVDAASYDEYRSRVDFLYSICQKNGLVIDKQNRNPSRLSRLPGVERNGKKQFIVDMNIGKSSFAEWKEWIEGINDNLPDPKSLSDVFSDMPELSPCLIEGVLRQGHKMLISGPSKAGKSFALIELSIAIAEGISWLGFNCTRGKVLYINLELDEASCFHRFDDVYKALGIQPKCASDIDIWNLRGNTVPLDKLVPKLVRRAAKKNYIAVIVDPIYKVITGDENNAEEMSFFCNQFDKIASELGTSVIYCHHHSKGIQKGKRSTDRMSGSGVFARDPDAVLDLLELEVPEKVYTELFSDTVKKVCVKWLNEYVRAWEQKCDTSELYSEGKALEVCQKLLPPEVYKDMHRELNAEREKFTARTAWKLEATLREFAKPKDTYMWFSYPLHVPESDGVLSDIDKSISNGSNYAVNFGNRKTNEQRKNDRLTALDNAYSFFTAGGEREVLISDIAEHLGITEKTVRNHINESENYYIADGKIGLRC